MREVFAYDFVVEIMQLHTDGYKKIVLNTTDF